MQLSFVSPHRTEKRRKYSQKYVYGFIIAKLELNTEIEGI